MVVAHQRLRQALLVAQEALDAGDTVSARAELTLFCHGFCVALSGHHAGEDTALFPELSARHPELRPTIAKLQQDHRMIAWLLGRFDHAIDSGAPPGELSQQLDGLAAIMESHFRYEERQLLVTLSRLDLHADPRTVLGPL